MTPAEWHAAAMHLAECYTSAAVALNYDVITKHAVTVDASRAECARLRDELAAHLLAYPVGEPIAHCSLTASGKIEHFDGNPMVMVGPVGNYLHPVPRNQAFRITAKAALGHRGKRARRQAFYSRARMARVLRRVMRGLPDIGPAVEQAHLDQLLYGTSVLQVSTTDGTKRGVDPRVMYFPADEGADMLAVLRAPAEAGLSAPLIRGELGKLDSDTRFYGFDGQHSNLHSSKGDAEWHAALHRKNGIACEVVPYTATRRSRRKITVLAEDASTFKTGHSG